MEAVVEQELVAQSTRTVKVFSTVGSNKSQCETSATNWETLQEELAGKGVLLSGMKAIVGGSEVTLESPNAQLPSGDFMLFLVPDKVKSGCIDHVESSLNTGSVVSDDEFGAETIDKEDAIELLEEAASNLQKVANFLKGAAPKAAKAQVVEDPELREMAETAKRLQGYSL